MNLEQKIARTKAIHADILFREWDVEEFLVQLARGTGAREMAIVRTKLQEARHWTEEAWKELEKEGEAQHNDKKE